MTNVDDLHVDIWCIILRHLRNPVPPPLSRPPRSALRQPHLTVCARVCKMFHDICKPLLYRTVITDDLPSFLSDFTSPFRQKLLAHTEHLYIEYCDKTFHVSYKVLMEGDEEAWYGLTITSKERQEAAIAICELELESIRLGIEPIAKGQTREILPNLTTVAVSSIYGVQDEVWTMFDDLQPPIPQESILDQANIMWRKFLSTSNITHWCFRSCVGPFSLNPISARCDRVSDDNAAITTIHFGKHSEIVCFAPGKKVRWISDMPSTHSWKGLELLLDRNIHMLTQVRLANPDSAKDGPIDVDVYCSTANLGGTNDHALGPKLVGTASELGHKPGERLSIAQQRVVADHFGQFWQKQLRDHSGVEDRYLCYASADSPICEACGSRAPRQGDE